MSSHPEADAFMRGYLREPSDVTARLVFADWLEETGTDPNRAWAYYIRLRADADRYPAGSPERVELEAEAAGYAPRIAARLTIPVALFLAYPKSLLQLLPAANITVRLGGFQPQPGVIEWVPESVAYENVLLPLDLQGNTLLVATGDPRDRDTAEKLEFVLRRSVVQVRADPHQIQEAIRRGYGEMTVDYDGRLFVEYTDPPGPAVSRTEPANVAGDDAPIARLVNLVLLEGIRLGAHRVHISPLAGVGVRYRVRGEWVTGDELPRRLLPAIAGRVARLAGLEAELARAGRAGGEFRVGFHGAVYTIRAAVEAAADGPVIDLDVADQIELDTGEYPAV